MDSQTESNLRERLLKRRDEIVTNLQRIDEQRRAVANHVEWMDESTYSQRRELFRLLSRSWHEEIYQVDQALARLLAGRYGICLGCAGTIELERLDAFPESEYCDSCQAIWERLARG
jgi:RNA polymerase-binding transcription factor DksA